MTRKEELEKKYKRPDYIEREEKARIDLEIALQEDVLRQKEDEELAEWREGIHRWDELTVNWSADDRRWAWDFITHYSQPRA